MIRTNCFANLLASFVVLVSTATSFAQGPFSFTRIGSVSTEGSPVEVVVADLDGDGIQDIANTTYGPTIQVRMGLGGGIFAPATSIYVGGGTYGIVAGDMNPNSAGTPKLPDLVVTTQQGHVVQLLNDPASPGTFPATQIVSGLNSGQANGAVLADIDGDGNLDIFIGYWVGGAVSYGDGLGGFDGPYTVLAETGIGTVGVAHSQESGTTRSYLLLTNNSTGVLHVKEPTAVRGVFTTHPSTALSGSGLSYPVPCDLNKDAHDDVVIPQYATGKLFVLHGRVDGGFDLTQTLDIGPNQSGGIAVSVDFDLDGNMDVAVFTTAGDVQLYRGSSNGVLSPDSALTQGLSGGYAHGTAGLLDGDNLPDLVVGSPAGQLTIFLNGQNHVPIPVAGMDQTFVIDAPLSDIQFTLDASGSTDPDGDALIYTWSGPFLEGGGTATGLNPVVTLPVGVNVVTLTVSDGSLQATAQVVITVLLNLAPVADAGPDQTSNTLTVELDGSGSTDPNGDQLTYTWSGPFAEGGGTVQGVSPTVTLTPGVHTLTLEAGDGRLSSFDTVQIEVVSNRPPLADAGVDRVVECNVLVGARVTLDGSGSSDPDGDALTYTWTGPFPEGGGTVSGAQPTVTLPLGASTITLRVSDGSSESFDTTDVQVNVHVEGLFNPLAELVVDGEGDPPVPTKAFKANRSIPLKLVLKCGSIPLTDVNVAPPIIEQITLDGAAQNIEIIDPDTGAPDDSGYAFRFVDNQWSYKISTRGWTSGRYLLGIRMPDGRLFWAGFEVR